MVKCSKVLQCSDGTSNKVSNIINPLNAELNPICHLLALLGGATIVVVSRLRVKGPIDNRELLLTCIFLLSHSLIFFRFIFYQYMVVFRFNTVIYVFLL